MKKKLEINGLKMLPNERGDYKIRISVGGYMFFDTPYLPELEAQRAFENLGDRLE